MLHQQIVTVDKVLYLQKDFRSNVVPPGLTVTIILLLFIAPKRNYIQNHSEKTSFILGLAVINSFYVFYNISIALKRDILIPCDFAPMFFFHCGVHKGIIKHHVCFQLGQQGIQLVNFPQRMPLKASATIQPSQTVGQLPAGSKPVVSNPGSVTTGTVYLT